MQQLISGNVQRGLSFLLTLNGSDVYPASEHVEAFIYTAMPRSAVEHIGIGVRPDVELRFMPSDVRELHDRYVLPATSGEGLMIGTSLGGTQLTVVTHLSATTTKLLREHYDALWSEAIPLEPIGRVAADS